MSNHERGRKLMAAAMEYLGEMGAAAEHARRIHRLCTRLVAAIEEQRRSEPDASADQ